MDQVRGNQRIAAALQSSHGAGRAVSYETQTRVPTRELRAHLGDLSKGHSQTGRARRGAAEAQDAARGYQHVRSYVGAHSSMPMGKMTERQAYLESQAAAGRNFYANLNRVGRPDQRHEMDPGSMYQVYGGYPASVKHESGGVAPKGKEKRASVNRRKKLTPPAISTPPPKAQGDISIFPRRKAGQSGIGSNRPPVVVTREVLEENFNMPLLQVCKKLGLCATVLKKVCRQLGVHKWPYKETKLTARRQGKLLGQAQAQAEAEAEAEAEKAKAEAEAEVEAEKTDAMEVKEEEGEEIDAKENLSANTEDSRGASSSASPPLSRKRAASDDVCSQEEAVSSGGEAAFASAPSAPALGGGEGVEAKAEEESSASASGMSVAMGEEDQESETLAVWCDDKEMIGEGAQDEFLALQGDLQGDLQQEEIRWWMCPSEHNGMLADTRGSFASSPAPDGTGLCVQQMSWADSN